LVAKGRDDFDGFIETKAALDELNFSEVEQDNLFRIIAAVLHLGNLTFTTDEDGLAELENAEVLDDFVGVLLGVSGTSFFRTRLIFQGGNSAKRS
jgi:myosin heavy subunit